MTIRCRQEEVEPAVIEASKTPSFQGTKSKVTVSWLVRHIVLRLSPWWHGVSTTDPDAPLSASPYGANNLMTRKTILAVGVAGLTWNQTLDEDGLALSDNIEIRVEIEATKAA
jgi:hypothetical protein